MGAIADWVSRMVSFIPAIRLNNVLEILIISVLIYYILIWIRDTRAWTLLKGILVICAFMLFAYVFQMDTILWLFQNLISVAIISIFVLFQPELRRALEQLGRKNILSSFFNLSGSGAADEQTVKTVEKTKSEIIKACMEMSKVRTGALIVIEQDVQLSEYERTGIFLDSLVSSQLLINIFEHNTPLHDGAVFIRNNRIVAATCYLPLSDNMLLSKELGTRHRAGVGISEVSDSITLIVSEETGMISVAHDGMLFRGLSQEELREQLSTLMKNQDAPKRSRWRRIIKNEKKLTDNLGMKIISLLLAIVFWLVVVTMEDPEQTKPLELPVTKINEELIRENDKTYEVIEGNTVTITVRARQSILKDLTAKDFEAVADFANLSFTGAVPIEITVLRNANQVTIERGANTMMRVSIEDLATVDKMVSTKAEGTVITGKALGSISVEPNMIRIEGAKTTIDRISSVYAVVNVSGISEDCSFVVEPVLYDSNGNKIDSTDITFSEDSLKVNVSLLDTKTVPVRWNIDVSPAEGYGIESSDYTPSEVDIAGSPEVLDAIDEIVLDDYSAEDISENQEAEVDLESIVKGLGAALARPDTDKTAKLAVKVEPYNRVGGTVAFDSVELTGKDDNYNYSIIGDTSISYTLYGLDADIETAERSKMKFSLDVTGLEPGTHTVNLQMTTSQEISLAAEVPVKIKIDSK